MHGWPVVMKAPRGGYDGRGVVIADDAAAAAGFLAELTGTPSKAQGGALLEPALAIEQELAVQVARTADGATAVYPVVETVQRDAMLSELICPAEIPGERALEAIELARTLVSHIGATGLVAVELFLTPEGLLVNELAMRPPQLRASHDRGERHLAVRAAPPREPRLAAGGHRAAGPGRGDRQRGRAVRRL